MDRLTVKDWPELSLNNCCALASRCEYKPGPQCVGCKIPQIYVRLAQYEDTGLEPGQIDPAHPRPIRVKVRRARA